MTSAVPSPFSLHLLNTISREYLSSENYFRSLGTRIQKFLIPIFPISIFLISVLCPKSSKFFEVSSFLSSSRLENLSNPSFSTRFTFFKVLVSYEFKNLDLFLAPQGLQISNRLLGLIGNSSFLRCDWVIDDSDVAGNSPAPLLRRRSLWLEFQRFDGAFIGLDTSPSATSLIDGSDPREQTVDIFIRISLSRGFPVELMLSKFFHVDSQNQRKRKRF